VNPTPTQSRESSVSRTRGKFAVALAAGALLALATAAPAFAGSGGAGPNASANCTAKAKAQLRDGKATIPCGAPSRVAKVIKAANRIAKGEGYCYGGGHRSFRDNCYDCSGAVSYALHGGNFVKSPMPSNGYFRWGKRGKGRWITVYTNSGHMYAVIAGLRFDTSMTPGKGPGWSKERRSSRGFKVRHPRNY
jgi:hypothetical protein